MRILRGACAICLLWASAYPGFCASLSGVVTDPAGLAVRQAAVVLLTSQGSPVGEARTDTTGSFRIDRLPAGSYRLLVSAEGFPAAESACAVTAAESTCSVGLRMEPVSDYVTVSATIGRAVDPRTTSHVVHVRDMEALRRLPNTTLGTPLQNAPAVAVQTTTHGHVSAFLRGMTGYHTLILMDGVRFNTALFRSGPNQYLSFIDPSHAGAIEALLGPASASYGSDALGGAVSVFSRQPEVSDGPRYWTGEIYAMGASADWSMTSAASVALSARNVWWLASGSARRLNDLRGGQGIDSRNVFRRYFGLGTDAVRDLLGDRMQDTGFKQYGGQTKAFWRLSPTRSLTGLYQRSELDGVRSYREQLGGVGRLRAEFNPQYGELGYVRFEQIQAGRLDSFSGRFSYNAISDGSIRQTLRPTDVLVSEGGRARAFGYATQGSTHLGDRHVQVFGAEYFDEQIAGWGERWNPTDPATIETVRPLVPDGARYGTFAGYAQNASELWNGRLRVTGGGRWSHVRFRTAGDAFGLKQTTQTFSDTTLHGSAALRLTPAVQFHSLVSKGFRAPNVSDLAALGQSGSGFEVPASDAAAAGALMGSAASDTALPAGPARTLRPETVWNYEAGVTVNTSRVYLRTQGFWAHFDNPVVRRTVLFPVGQVPAVLAGVPVTPLAQSGEQLAAGVVAVVATADPRSVKALVNDGQARYSGVELLGRWKLNRRWTAEGGWSYMGARVLYPNRPVRRLPPQQGLGMLRFVPGGRKPDVELAAMFAGPQRHVSQEDLDDERIGASRSRNDIAAFFAGGYAQSHITSGIFQPTGETLTDIQNRVLPPGAVINGVPVSGPGVRVPMMNGTSGWLSLDIRSGIPLSENARLYFGVTNILDRNYRVHGSGVDMAGRNAFAGVRYQF